MNNFFSLAAILGLMIFAQSCGEGDSSSPPVVQPPSDAGTVLKNVEYYDSGSTSGPDYSSEDAATISGNQLSLTRTGGEFINTGIWIISLSKEEIAEINSRITAIGPDDGDLIMDRGIIGSGPDHIFINDNKYYNNWTREAVGDTNYHYYSAHLQAFDTTIRNIILDHYPEMKASSLLHYSQ